MHTGAGGASNPEELHQTRKVLVYILDTSLKLLHPYMPFVTEQLWHHLPRTSKTKSLMLSNWPQLNDEIPNITSEEDTNTFQILKTVTKSTRNARSEYDVPPSKRISATIVITNNDGILNELQKELKSLILLAKLDPQKVYLASNPPTLETNTLQLVISDTIKAILPLEDLVDVEKEKLRLEKQLNKMQKDMHVLEGRLGSNGFMDKAPVHIVEKVKEDLEELRGKEKNILNGLENL